MFRLNTHTQTPPALRQLGHRVAVHGRDRVGDQLQPVEIPSHNICLRKRGGQLACPEDAVDDGMSVHATHQRNF